MTPGGQRDRSVLLDRGVEPALLIKLDFWGKKPPARMGPNNTDLRLIDGIPFLSERGGAIAMIDEMASDRRRLAEVGVGREISTARFAVPGVPVVKNKRWANVARSRGGRRSDLILDDKRVANPV